jgi:hypothetical protein
MGTFEGCSKVLLSELFPGKTDGGDWFDVLLDSDTRLFVDPFLIHKETEGRWAGALDELIAHSDETSRRWPDQAGTKKVLISRGIHLVFPVGM